MKKLNTINAKNIVKIIYILKYYNELQFSK